MKLLEDPYMMIQYMVPFDELFIFGLKEERKVLVVYPLERLVVLGVLIIDSLHHILQFVEGTILETIRCDPFIELILKFL